MELMTSIQVNDLMRETTAHGTPAFPIGVYTDDFSLYNGHIVAWHWHPEVEFAVVTRGAVEFIVGETHLPLQAGEGIFVNSGALHMARQAPGCTDALMFSTVFSPRLLCSGKDSPIYTQLVQPVTTDAALPAFRLCLSTPWQAEMLSALHGLYRSARAGRFGKEIEYLVHVGTLWHALVTHLPDLERTSVPQRERHSELRVKKMLSYIHLHYADDLSVDHIAAAAGVSRSECFRCFRQVLQRRPLEYLIDYRLEQAARLIAQTDTPISQVATACGMGHASYFDRRFKQRYGLTPLAYRKQKQP